MENLPVVEVPESSNPPNNPQAVKNRTRKKQGKVNPAQAVALRRNGATLKTIADLQGVSESAVQKRLLAILPTEETKVFEKNRAGIFAHLQMQMLQNLRPAKLQKSSARDLVVSAGILYDKERLERGLSTENVSLRACITDVREAQAAKAQALREMQRIIGMLPAPENEG